MRVQTADFSAKTITPFRLIQTTTAIV